MSPPHAELQAQPPESLPLLYAEVIVPRHLLRAFTYLVPPRLQTGEPLVGRRVLVPFAANRLHGLVVALSATPPAGLSNKRLKEIVSLASDHAQGEPDANLVALSRQIAEDYLVPWGQCLRLVFPPPQPARFGRQTYQLTDTGRMALGSGDHVSVQARALLSRLARRKSGLSLATLEKGSVTNVQRTLAGLKKHGWISERDTQGSARRIGTQCDRESVDLVEPPTQNDQEGRQRSIIALPDLDASWRARLTQLVDHREDRTCLLHAPVAHRMACLAQLAREVITRNRTVLIVTGEAAWASWIAQQFEPQWGRQLTLLHSGLSLQERTDAWTRIASRSVRLVVGTRSAVFAPLDALGLVWVDGEEDPSLKEEQEPHYHAREIARLRARQANALCVLGSSHPLLETQKTIGNVGTKLALPVPRETAPIIELVDLRRFAQGTLLTRPMVEGIRSALDQQTVVILFLNRKGYASALVCRECGEIPRCPRCRVAVTYHRQAGRLACRYCGHVTALPEICPACAAPRLEPVGSGTERLEEEIRRLFPKTRVARFDRGAIRRASQGFALRQRLWAGEIDIVIGTQMLFQQGPLPRVGFVGVPLADAGLHQPDFRSAERTYHGLLDAVGLAKSQHEGGRVVLQTFLPGHHAINAVVTGNPAAFSDVELSFRAALGYPPYAHLIRLLISGKRVGQVEAAAARWVALLKAEAESIPGEAAPLASQPDSPLRDGVTGAAMILGPVAASMPQLRGRHRWQVLVKSPQRALAHRVVRATLEKIEHQGRRGDLRFDVDVDPVSIG